MVRLNILGLEIEVLNGNVHLFDTDLVFKIFILKYLLINLHGTARFPHRDSSSRSNWSIWWKL